MLIKNSKKYDIKVKNIANLQQMDFHSKGLERYHIFNIYVTSPNTKLHQQRLLPDLLHPPSLSPSTSSQSTRIT